jgi:hypothetical protein
VVEEVPKKISSTNSDNFGSTNTIQPLSKLVNKLKICSLSSIAFEFPQSESSPFQNSIRTLWFNFIVWKPNFKPILFFWDNSN